MIQMKLKFYLKRIATMNILWRTTNDLGCFLSRIQSEFGQVIMIIWWNKPEFLNDDAFIEDIALSLTMDSFWFLNWNKH
jgi:hypothetical protein